MIRLLRIKAGRIQLSFEIVHQKLMKLTINSLR